MSGRSGDTADCLLFPVFHSTISWRLGNVQSFYRWRHSRGFGIEDPEMLSLALGSSAGIMYTA